MTGWHITITQLTVPENPIVEFTLAEEDVEDWVVDDAVKVWMGRQDVKFYYKSDSNLDTVLGMVYYEDPACKCTTILTGLLQITVEEV